MQLVFSYINESWLSNYMDSSCSSTTKEAVATGQALLVLSFFIYCRTRRLVNYLEVIIEDRLSNKGRDRTLKDFWHDELEFVLIR